MSNKEDHVRNEIIFLTSNVNKFREAQSVLNRFGIRLKRMGMLERLEIQSESLEEISIYSAIHGYQMLRKPVITEDAGLFVFALRGFPGPYSSYIFRTIGVHGLLKLLDDITQRNAIFKSVVTFFDGTFLKTFSGTVQGEIATECKGNKGFGFDPIFTPKHSSNKTFGEMNKTEKNKYSHRAKAFTKFAKWYSSTFKIKPS